MDNDADLAAALDRSAATGVLKTRRLGYDGKGQRVFRNASAADAAGVFAAMGGVPLILESFVPFEREISVIAARGQDGRLAAYDPAENVHRDGILRVVDGSGRRFRPRPRAGARRRPSRSWTRSTMSA